VNGGIVFTEDVAMTKPIEFKAFSMQEQRFRCLRREWKMERR
jgi:hypothetical protein